MLGKRASFERWLRLLGKKLICLWNIVEMRQEKAKRARNEKTGTRYFALPKL